MCSNRNWRDRRGRKAWGRGLGPISLPRQWPKQSDDYVPAPMAIYLMRSASSRQLARSAGGGQGANSAKADFAKATWRPHAKPEPRTDA